MMKHLFDYIEWKEKTENELEKYYRQKTNMRLKYAAFTSIGISIILQLVLIFFMDVISDTAYLLIRGFTGVFAIIFVILVGIFTYRVNSAYYKDKAKPNRESNTL